MTVYSMVEVVGTSGTSVSEAIQGAVERASASFEGLQWFEVKEIRGRILPDDTPEYQVRLAMGFELQATDTPRDESREAGKKPGSRQARSQAAQVAAKRGERGRSDLAKGFREQPRRGKR